MNSGEGREHRYILLKEYADIIDKIAGLRKQGYRVSRRNPEVCLVCHFIYPDGHREAVQETHFIERALQIANEIKRGDTTIGLILDECNSPEPFMTVVRQGIGMQGELLRTCSISEFKEWVKTSNHKYNNEIRRLVCSYL